MEREERKRHLAARSWDYDEKSPQKRPRTGSDLAEPHIKRGTRYGIPSPVDLYAHIFPDRSSPHPPRSKSKDGHFRFVNGDNIGSRYKILCLMGEGTFGRVLECWDRHLRVTVAIKVIRSVPKYREAAMIELEVLNTITNNDPAVKHCCIHLQRWFDYRGHVCIVFEKLGISLYDFMHRNAFRPFPLDVVQHFAKQMLHAIAFLHSLQIVHTDLKPENILLKSSEYVKLDKDKSGRLGCRVPLNPDVRVIDFGSATFNDDRHSTVVSTRHYRAPEVILGLGWSYECDIWSAGCIIVELITGRALFQTHENLEHLAMMERVLDRIPTEMTRRAAQDARKYFGHNDNLLWCNSASRKSIKAVQQLTTLRRLLKLEADASATLHLDSLYSLLREMLSYQPQRRWSAKDCLGHHFFRENIRSLLPNTEDEGEEEGREESVVRAPPSSVMGPSNPQSIASRETTDTCPPHVHAQDEQALPNDEDDIAGVAPSAVSLRPRRPLGGGAGAAEAQNTGEGASRGGTGEAGYRLRSDGDGAVLASEAKEEGGRRGLRQHGREGAAGGAAQEQRLEAALQRSRRGPAKVGALRVRSESGNVPGEDERERVKGKRKPAMIVFNEQKAHEDTSALGKAESSRCRMERTAARAILNDDAPVSDQAENLRWPHVSCAGV